MSRQLIGPAAAMLLHGATSVTTLALNDSDNSVGSVFQATKDGVIDRIGVSVSAKSGSSATVKYNVGLVTVDAVGLPTSTSYGGSALKTVAIADFSSSAYNWITLDTPATVNAGDLVATRIWPEGVVNPDGSNSITVRYTFGFIGSGIAGLPYAVNFATAWSKNLSFPLLAARYSDGVVGQIAALNTSAVLGTAFTQSTSPDECGAKFQLGVEAVCSGARIQIDPAAVTTSFEVRLYNSVGTVIASAVVATNILASALLSQTDVYWDPVTLAANTDYRLTVLSTSADNLQLVQIATPDTDSKNGLPYGDKWGLTSRADLGAWTDTPNTVPLQGIWVDSISINLTTTLQFSVLE